MKCASFALVSTSFVTNVEVVHMQAFVTGRLECVSVFNLLLSLSTHTDSRYLI